MAVTITAKRLFVLPLSMLAMMLTSCAGDPDGLPDSSPPSVDETAEESDDGSSTTDSVGISVDRDDLLPASTSKPSATDSTPGTGIDPSLVAMANQARDDLADRLRVDPSSVVVLSADIVVWPNAALGCPEPDRSYPDGPVDGSRIVLDHEGTRYAYHTGGSQLTPFLCE